MNPDRECDESNICEQLCVLESVNSTTEICSCNSGFTLDDNRVNCTGMQ